MNFEKALELQNNIKTNNMEYQDFVSDIDKWIKKRSNKTDTKIPNYVEPPANQSKPEIKSESKNSSKKSKSSEYKQIGNNHFKNGEYSKSIDSYTLAMNSDPSNPILYSNRAISYIKLNLYDKAIKDCTSCLKIDNTFTKALYRRAFACLKTRKYKQAVKDIQNFLDYQPNSKEAISVLEQAEAYAEAYKLASTGKYDISADEIDSRVIVPKFGSFDGFENMNKVTIEDVKEVKKDASAKKEEIYQEEDVEKIISSLKIPQNYAEFEKTIKGFGDSLLLFYKYFKKICPDDYRRLFSEMLEASILEKIIRGLKNYENDGRRVIEVLEKMTDAKRFSFVVLFLNPEEKEVLREMIETFGENACRDKIERIKKIYLQ